MDKKFHSFKIVSIMSMFLLVGIGRFVNLYYINFEPILVTILSSIYYGIFISAIGYFLFDLVLAKGFIELKNKALMVLTILLLLIVIFESIFSNYISFHFIFYFLVKLILSGLIILSLIYFDLRSKKINRINMNHELPAKYLRKRPIKTIIETVFRLFPHAEPIGLYKIGNPDKKSPVYVTGNFEMTIRRVVKALKGKDCWLLVSDSRGINIWCSTEAKHFGTQNIIDIINETNLSDFVDHHKLILPQLLASNVNLKLLKSKTGFNAVFGPVYIENIDLYNNDVDNPEIRKVKFNLLDRIEMSFGSPIIFVSLLLLIFNFIGLQYLIVILPTIYFINFINAIKCYEVKIKNMFLRALILGALAFVAIYLFIYIFALSHIWLYSLTIGLGISYLTLEFEGWSPLVKFNYGYNKIPEIEVDQDLCIGCKQCVYVCPKSVFKMIDNKAVVIDESECVLCKSCFRQCPTKAIKHSLDK